jgi:hypothetical protein
MVVTYPSVMNELDFFEIPAEKLIIAAHFLHIFYQIDTVR